MDKLYSKKKLIMIFGIMLSALVVNLFYWGSRKEGFFGDELYSYHFVNQTDYPYITEDRGNETWMNSWHTSDYFLDYLTTDGEEAFDISATYLSIRKDVHPPLYYLLLKIFCSVFSLILPSVFSKWCGILLNILFFILTIPVLFKLAEYFTKSSTFAIITCILYGFSIGAVSTVVFLRMYMMFTFFSVLFTYINALLWKRLWEEKSDSGIAAYAALCLSTIMGILSHYYFVVYAFFISAFIWVYSVIAKKYRFAIKYALTMVIGILGSYLIWPDMRNDIFVGYRGEEAFENFAGSTDWNSFKEFLSVANAELFSGCSGLILILFALASIYIMISLWWNVEKHITQEGNICILFERKEKKQKKELQISYADIVIMQIFLAVACYIYLISKIAPYREDRYIFNTFPMVMLVVTYVAHKLLSAMSADRISRIIVLFAMFAVMTIGYISPGVNYLYKGTRRNLVIADLYSDLPTFYISGGSTFRTCGDSVYLSKAPAIYPARVDGIDSFSGALEQLDGMETSRCLVYIDLEISDLNTVVSQVKQELGVNEVRYLFDTEYSAAYIAE